MCAGGVAARVGGERGEQGSGFPAERWRRGPKISLSLSLSLSLLADRWGFAGGVAGAVGLAGRLGSGGERTARRCGGRAVRVAGVVGVVEGVRWGLVLCFLCFLESGVRSAVAAASGLIALNRVRSVRL